MNLPDWLILWVWRSLLGEIYPAIRGIAVGYSDKKRLVIRYYLDRQPEGEDYESIECVITNILSHASSNEEIVSVDKEAVFSLERLVDLDPLDGFVYARREYSE